MKEFTKSSGVSEVVQRDFAQLPEKQEKSIQDARLAHERIENVKQKLKSLKQGYLVNKAGDEKKMMKKKRINMKWNVH
ncbi:hypothetical protein L1887_11139 [Cichorium endivia]|nr:hypothetical protein L1887_11139 [Cichorium endivia]